MFTLRFLRFRNRPLWFQYHFKFKNLYATDGLIYLSCKWSIIMCFETFNRWWVMYRLISIISISVDCHYNQFGLNEMGHVLIKMDSFMVILSTTITWTKPLPHLRSKSSIILSSDFSDFPTLIDKGLIFMIILLENYRVFIGRIPFTLKKKSFLPFHRAHHKAKIQVFEWLSNIGFVESFVSILFFHHWETSKMRSCHN